MTSINVTGKLPEVTAAFVTHRKTSVMDRATILRNLKLTNTLRAGKIVITNNGERVRAIPGKFMGQNLQQGDIFFAEGVLYTFEGFTPYHHRVMGTRASNRTPNLFYDWDFYAWDCVGVEIFKK